MQRFLVTGATGFIGHHLVRRLRGGGAEVRCLVRSRARGEHLARMGATLIDGDVTDPQSLGPAVGDVDAVIHLAGLTKSVQPRDLWRVNEAGTRHLATACAASPRPPVLLYVSSLAAAGPNPTGRPRTEIDPSAPVSYYGQSKRAGELAAAGFADQLPITIVRPPIVLGQGDRDGLELFRSIARWNLHVVPGQTDAPYSVIHAADLAAALVAAAKRGRRLRPGDESTGVYFASADERVSYSELGRMVGRALGRTKVRVWRSGPTGVWTVAAVNELVAKIRRKPHILGLDKAREATAGGWACLDTALRQDTGFAPERPLQSRLDETARWYREQGWLPAIKTEHS